MTYTTLFPAAKESQEANTEQPIRPHEEMPVEPMQEQPLPQAPPVPVKKNYTEFEPDDEVLKAVTGFERG